jgi:FKBP-type peptidyl-prolyl cis-trans isomerase SlpA
LTVGVDHPRLPGLGSSLVGLSAGASATVHVSADQAFGLPDPSRVQRWARRRFPKDQALTVGKWVKFQTTQGKNCLVRILKVQDNMVVVDTNRRWAGQAMDIEVELIAIQSGDPTSVVVDPKS